MFQLCIDYGPLFLRFSSLIFPLHHKINSHHIHKPAAIGVSSRSARFPRGNLRIWEKLWKAAAKEFDQISVSFFFSRKVVVLQKTEEEAFGFEIQVRGLTAIYGRDFLTSQAPFNRISLIGRRRWYFGDWNMNVWSCKSLNPNACLRRRGWKVTHQSNTPLMLVPWLKRRGDDFYSFSLSFPAFILSRVVCSHALRVIPASLPPARQADASHIRPQCLSRCAHVALKRSLTCRQDLILWMVFWRGKKWSKCWFECFCSNVFVGHFLEVGRCVEEKTYCSIYGFDGGSRPSCLPAAGRKWDHEGRFDSIGERERDEFAAGFTPCDVNVRIQHANVIFAFQRYLHGFVFIFQTAEREAHSEPAANTDPNYYKFP